MRHQLLSQENQLAKERIFQKKLEAPYSIKCTKLIGLDCPDWACCWFLQVLQVNHRDCMCARQEARNWWRPACLNKGFACVIVSLQRGHGGAERLRAKKIRIAVMELQHSTVQSHLRWELCPLWWKRSLGTLWASLLTLGSRSALCLDWWHPLIPWQKELKCSTGRGGRD